MFLMIENHGVAPVQSFTVMGLSTARGKAEKIGQFGSGSKHGILTCMRQNIVPTIYLGENELKFATTTDKMGEKEYQHLIYEFRGEIKELPIALEFGALDWDGLDMGLREFVSNAIDAGDYKVEVVAKPETHKDKTRIFLPFRPEVAKFFAALPEKFLHFAQGINTEQVVMLKEKISPAKFYRKGVYVRESKAISLFNYNFDDKVKIDECRNMEEYAVREHSANIWQNADKETVKLLFNRLDDINEKVFEGNFYFCSWRWDAKGIANWKAAWKELFGDAYCGNVTTQAPLIAKAQKQGHNVINVPTNLLDALVHCGIPMVVDCLQGVDKAGREIQPATIKLTSKVRKIWDKLVEKGMVNGKEFPKVNTFTCLMNGESQLKGFYNPADLSINLEVHNGLDSMTIVEELGHYITGATDNSRDFQDYFIKLCVICLRV